MIAIGSDHGGFALKNEVMKYLEKNGYDIKDMGAYDESSSDYADFGLAVAEAVKSGECEKGIVICGTGLGISIAANKVPGIRAAVCTDSFMAKMSRAHNNANILSLGARVIGIGVALEIVETWLNTEFEGERHLRRINKISDIEKKYFK